MSAWRALDEPRYRAEFYRMWQVGQGAGLTHETILSRMGATSRSPQVNRLRAGLLRGARARQSVRDTLRAQPQLIPPFEAALLALGEETGSLEESLRSLATYCEAEQRLMWRLKRLLASPLMQAFAAVLIAPFPILFLGSAMLYFAVVLVGFIAVSLAGGGVLQAAARRYGRRPAFVAARLCRAVATAVEAGLPLDRSVDAAVAATDHAGLAAHVRRIPPRQRTQQPLAETFRGAPGLPPEVVSALQVADVSGNYGDTLRKLAALYDPV